MAVFDRRLATRAVAPATSGFSAGILLETVCGVKPIERLQQGDALASGHGQAVLVHWCGVVGWGRGICIPEGALGDGQPTRTIVVGAEQCISVTRKTAIPLVGHPAPWIRAGDLLDTCDRVWLARSRTAMVAVDTHGAMPLCQAGVEFRSSAPMPPHAKPLLIGEMRSSVADAHAAPYDQGECDGRPILDAREVAWLFKDTPTPT